MSKQLSVFLGCPCEEGCPNGCTGCSNAVCQCEVNNSACKMSFIYWLFKVKETNEYWLKCRAENNHDLDLCINDCGGNADCAADCNGDFSTWQLQCPCEVKKYSERANSFLKVFVYLFSIFKENYIGGCPCENYPCTPPNAVLVLNTRSDNIPMIIDFDGETIVSNILLNCLLR